MPLNQAISLNTFQQTSFGYFAPVMIKTVAYPRAALIGNPSDGYFGKTIAFVFKNFQAEVELEESQHLHIIPCDRDRMDFSSLSELANEISEFGYYGGVRLIKASLKTFADYCGKEGITLSPKNFTIRYASTIPHRLGLAGSSAIVTATIRSLMEFYSVEIDKPQLANLILSVEKNELKISAGLQDRVAQVYGQPVYMNFDEQLMKETGAGEYIAFDKQLLPPLFLAYRTNLSEGSEVTHNDLAARFAKQDPAVLHAVLQWKELTTKTWAKLQAGDKDIAALLNENFDIREQVCEISSGNKQLIQAARNAGASAKFTGSGGAIIGTYTNDQMLQSIIGEMKKINAVVILPDIA